MTLTNALIINKNMKVNNQYISKINDMALISVEDFSNKTQIVNKVNNYINTNTKGMIKDVLKESSVDGTTILLLINTIYFKANWLHRFNKSNTEKMEFRGDTVQQIDTMYQKDKFNYLENNKFQLLEMKYKNEDYAMGIILSKNGDIYKPSLDELNKLNKQLYEKKVKIWIPKFTHRKRISLVPILQKLGIGDLFGIQARLDIAEYAYVSDIIHEAVVQVDEEGTEAAAVTIMNMDLMAGPPSEIPTFKADHSFAYYIKHIPSNMILFYGDFRGN